MPALNLMACDGFYPEVAQAIAAEGWTDVRVCPLPAYCGRPPWSWEQIAGQLGPDERGPIVLLGSACLSAPPQPPDGHAPLQPARRQQCFHLLAPPALVDDLLASGAYLMTPTWLKNWRERVAELGFPGPRAAAFFQEFARRLVLLDTGQEGDLSQELKSLSAELGLPLERVAVGDGPLRDNLHRLVSQWQLETARQAAQQAEKERRGMQAESLVVMDLLTRLTQEQQEEPVQAQIEAIFRMLFAPEIYRLHLCSEQDPDGNRHLPEPCRQLASGREPYAWTESGSGFLVALRRGEQALAVVEADRLAFPAYKERYLGLALSIASVAALALEEARNRRRLIEAEKMVSLGSLVAGVAHEINTPAGVCLAAASTLEGQSRRLAELFANRKMTQSELNSYLESAIQAAELMTSNLNRIGRLIESFRQVAVEKAPPALCMVGFRALLEEVLGGLGRGTLGEALQVEIDCDPGLRLLASSRDWGCILTNLYTNSLRHGFKGRERGLIRISARERGRMLAVDYTDDGNGITEQVRRQVFDPFFTTDMQQGMGLGMHLVYNLIQQRLGGTIQCEPRPSGVCFRILTPLRRENEDDERG